MAEDITSVRQIVWRTTLSKKVDEFRSVIEDDAVFEKYFGQKYVEALVTKSREMGRLYEKLGIIYILITISLFASKVVGDSEAEFFGYGVKNISSYKEPLLLIAALLSPATAVLGAYRTYLKALVTECLKKMSPDAKVRGFYSLVFVDDYFDNLVYRSTDSDRAPHGITVALFLVFVIALLSLAVAVLVGSFFIQVSVLADVMENPSTPGYVNSFVVVVSIAAMAFSWLVAIIQLPMPEVDRRNLNRLNELEKTEPAEYERIMRRLVNENKKKDARSTIGLSVIVFVGVFALLSFLYSPELLANVSRLLVIALLGLAVVVATSKAMVQYSTRRTLMFYFDRYREKDASLTKFKWLSRFWIATKLIFPLCVTLAYFLALRANGLL